MNGNVNSLLSPKGMSEMSVINDRNVDGSNKHPIKYRTRLFYIRHLVITISIFTSYSAANIRALFSFLFDIHINYRTAESPSFHDTVFGYNLSERSLTQKEFSVSPQIAGLNSALKALVLQPKSRCVKRTSEEESRILELFEVFEKRRSKIPVAEKLRQTRIIAGNIVG
ncbi:hypothetical protein ALC57_09149 [Trachymyrmex cornetzi]|uniref:Uncharacterized protein n=1 Tax=Trachymyrmex cornetzi TaxID=471704 RepID=A0A195E0R3_9HYME|nr:hypothetical protein ALC57_09149 [Trachymyrmex cornetzi]